MAKSSSKQHRKNGRKHGKKTMKGGDGTSDNAIRVFGNMNEQHAGSETDNTIAMNSPAVHPVAPAMQGGNVIEKISELQDTIFGKDKAPEMGGNNDLEKLQEEITEQVKKLEKEGGEEVQEKIDILKTAVQAGGSGVLENIAVPAILLYANQKYSNKKRFSHGKAKLRRTSRRVRKMRK